MKPSERIYEIYEELLEKNGLKEYEKIGGEPTTGAKLNTFNRAILQYLDERVGYIKLYERLVR